MWLSVDSCEEIQPGEVEFFGDEVHCCEELQLVEFSSGDELQFWDDDGEH